jgi:hypothetical protein
MALERAVPVVVDFGVLEEFSALYLGQELSLGEEKVVFAIDLTVAWRSGGAGNGEDRLACFTGFPA